MLQSAKRVALSIYFAVLVSQSLADIKLIRSTATSLEWDLSGVLEPGKKYSIEVLLKAPTGDVRVIDGRLRSGATSYTASNLRPNKQYQLLVFDTSAGEIGEDIVSVPVYTNLQCYSCNGATSADHCSDVVECPSSHRQCYTQVRYYSRNGRGRFYIFKGCKHPKDRCLPNQERLDVIKYASSETGDLSPEDVLEVMPGLKFFGGANDDLLKSPSVLQRAKKLLQQKKENALQNALKKECARGKEDENDFCRCCCSQERCNHAMLDCGMTLPPEIVKTEPLPPDIATPPPETTAPVLTPRKIPPACRDFNGGCDHICIAVNRTSARCECMADYELQADGKSCETHLKHAVADAGPDITVTLPQDMVVISAKETKGAVGLYKWWDPIVVGEGGGLTTSDPYQRDLTVTDLKVGNYRFILMVTGQDGRRTSDSMTLTVQSRFTDSITTPRPRRTQRPRAGLISFNRFSSAELRNEWKNSGDRYRESDDEPTSEPRTRGQTLTPTKLIFRVIPGVPGKRPPPRPQVPRRPVFGRPRTTTTVATTTTPAPVLCPLLEGLDERQVTAVCTNSNVEGSTCEFTCEGERTLQGGSESASCEAADGSAQWLSELEPVSLPCCKLPCPASAYADIYFLIHSSSKIGRLDWKKILNLAFSMVSDATFGNNGVCAGAARYNRFPDPRNAIALDCSRTKEDFEKQLLAIPFFGAGTNTAGALNYLRTKGFAGDANRADAQDVAIVITDSKSTVNVGKAAKDLKATGVKVIVLGLKTRGGAANLVEMKSIASSPAAAINTPSIPAAPPAALVTQLQAMICDNECK